MGGGSHGHGDFVQRLQEVSSNIRLETMCLCVPLRLGVILSAAFTFFTSVLYVCDRSYWQPMFRPFTGGFCLKSQLAIGFIEYTGILFGLLGMLGAWYVRKSYVLWFNYWQMARLLAWIYMYIVDVPVLQSCELWVNDIQKIVQESGWNDLMYQIALHAECPSTREHFFILSSITLVVFMYIIWCTAKYAEYMGVVPKHLLRTDKDLAPGAFYAHSHGERSVLNGTYAANHNLHKLGQVFVPKGLMTMISTGGGMYEEGKNPMMKESGIPVAMPAMPGLWPGVAPGVALPGHIGVLPPGTLPPSGMPPPGMTPHGPMGMPPGSLGAVPPVAMPPGQMGPAMPPGQFPSYGI